MVSAAGCAVGGRRSRRAPPYSAGRLVKSPRHDATDQVQLQPRLGPSGLQRDRKDGRPVRLVAGTLAASRAWLRLTSPPLSLIASDAAYFETELSRPNAEFFIRHALHDSADFVFIVNGPAQLRFPDHLPNVRVVQRDNSCYDLGSHGEVLEANDRALVKKYDKFILMNASVRGPFLPHWLVTSPRILPGLPLCSSERSRLLLPPASYARRSRECWSSAFTNMVTDKVKLAGLTMNCIEGVTEVDWLGIKVGDPSVVSLRHLQAMLLATDRTGLALLLVPAGLSACHDEYIAAIDTEIRLSSLIRAAGFKLDAAMSLFQDADDFSDACTAPNPFDAYPGGMLHPHELMFVKSRAGTPDDVIERYTHFARGYDSHRFCRAR